MFTWLIDLLNLTIKPTGESTTPHHNLNLNPRTHVQTEPTPEPDLSPNLKARPSPKFT
jgi:hypothetical protein